MTPEQDNKATVGRLYQAFRAGDTAALDGLLASDFINHNPRTTNGLDASKALFAQVGAIDADLHRMVAEGDLVAVHVHGKQRPDDRGIVSMDMFRVENGRLVEHWDVSQEIPETSANDNGMW